MDNQKKILIVGAGTGGYELSDEISTKFKGKLEVAGFIDDDEGKIGTTIKGIKILGAIKNIAAIVKKIGVDSIFIAIPSAKGETIRQILTASSGVRIAFKIIPRSLEIIEGHVKLDQLREVDISDLLGSAIVKSEQPAFRKQFRGKRILVTGAAGSIGSELCRQLIQFSPSLLVALDWWENGLFELGTQLGELKGQKKFQCIVGNIQDRNAVSGLIRKFKPQIIFHAAAFKHVPLMQENPLEAIRNNVFGTENIAKLSYEEGVEKFIYISTDKAADPVNILGTTKLIGEHIIGGLSNLGGTKFIAVRFGNVLESSGSVIPIFRKQIANGGPLTVTDPKMMRFMMTIPEAIQLILHASILGNGGEIFILYMGEQISIAELAGFMVQLAGFIPGEDIKIKYTGKRAGEKIEEQLIASEEYFEKTENDRIFKASRYAENIDLYQLADLKAAVETNNLTKALSILRKFAPNLNK